MAAENKDGGARVAGTLAALRNVPAADGIGALRSRGFKSLAENELVRRIAGNTLIVMGLQNYFGDDNQVKIVSSALGRRLVGGGTWRIAGGRICHSARPGHEFCTGIFFRGDDVLCWPGIGRYSGDKAYLRDCTILRGNRTASAPIGEVVAALRDVPHKNGVREMAKQGFVRLSGKELWRRVAGNTLRIGKSLGYFAKDRKVRITDGSLGRGLASSGTWKITKLNICHSVRKGHEFCSGLFFRNNEILCWPGIGEFASDTGYIRRCGLLRGNMTP